MSAPEPSRGGGQSTGGVQDQDGRAGTGGVAYPHQAAGARHEIGDHEAVAVMFHRRGTLDLCDGGGVEDELHRDARGLAEDVYRLVGVQHPHGLRGGAQQHAAADRAGERPDEPRRHRAARRPRLRRVRK
ncbi:hypothetical protein [Nonomuraea indica]|uniref:Uncharacterized protein n=1 Tax=Nonomuraea indica TaxID=1581193 RepID=A0ABW8A1D5_9ACTN